MNKKTTFMYGAMILTAAGVIVKILGAIFRIPLGNWIGADGMAYYEAVYPIYVLLLTVATTGIPVAISRMVSEKVAVDDKGGANRVFKVSMAVMIVLGLVLFSVLFFGADWIASNFKGLGKASLGMKAIAPALILVPIMAAFRGYFQGHQDMKPTALSQMTEQLFRVVFGLGLAYFLLKMGSEYAAAGGTFGATAGAAAGLVVILIVFLKRRKSISFREKREVIRQENHYKRDSAMKIMGNLFYIAVPITIGAAIMPIMKYIDLWIVTDRLTHAGWDEETVRTLFGQLSGFASPVVNLPKFITQAIAVSMVPAIVSAFKRKDKEFMQYNISLGMRFTMIIGLPCTVGIMILSEPIMLLLYSNQKEDALGAASCMFVLAIGIVFLASIETLTGVLQGVGKQIIPVINLAIGIVFKIFITFTLTPIKDINILGAAIGTVVAYIIATALNYRSVIIYTGTKFDLKLTFLRPLISVAAMGVVVFLIFSVFNPYVGSNLATVAAIPIGGIVYIVMLFLTKSIVPEEFKMLPKGDSIYKMYKKLFGKKS